VVGRLDEVLSIRFTGFCTAPVLQKFMKSVLVRTEARRESSWSLLILLRGDEVLLAVSVSRQRSDLTWYP
jgi:hypothetical protein